ncbi:unnamed protein product, partial [Durusdinium trenchii]
NSYLDTRNNVCHVGHSHPRVARAVAQQVEQLNTNTRYLHPNLCLLAKRLTETFPTGSGLEVCFFVNSGSEANDLATRLAFARSRSRNIIVVDHGYHGHTQQTIEISPYKFDHKGGEGAKPNIFKVPCPDTFRGEDAGERYAADVATGLLMVTMGKPFGNGMPLAAVVTTKEVSDAFHNGLEYFNTFGGNPVCCAAGLAVLDTCLHTLI